MEMSEIREKVEALRSLARINSGKTFFLLWDAADTIEKLAQLPQSVHVQRGGDMTNQEAIKCLSLMAAEVEWEHPMDWQVAIEMAIEALEWKKWRSYERDECRKQD